MSAHVGAHGQDEQSGGGALGIGSRPEERRSGAEAHAPSLARLVCVLSKLLWPVEAESGVAQAVGV